MIYDLLEMVANRIADQIFDNNWTGKYGEKLTERELKLVNLFGRKGKILKNLYLPKNDGGTSEIDLVICPCAAFDAACNRLGMGAGFYDRFLLKLRPDAFIWAAAFEIQKTDELFSDPWDVRMSRVYTENGCIICPAEISRTNKQG